MDQQTIVAEIEGRAKAAQLPIADICRRADVHPTTFSRWKKSARNPSPIGATLASLAKIDAVLKTAEVAAKRLKGPA